MINLGYLRHNDMFKFENETYRAGHTDGQGLGWVICTNVKTNKIKKIHIDSPVEVVKERRMSECKTCPTYDSEKHYCSTFCKVIKDTIDDIRADAYQQGRADMIDELVKRMKKLQFRTGRAWFDFDAGIDRCIEIAEQLKEQK